MADSYVLRFLFEELDIRGAFVRLGAAWQGMQRDRAYPATVTRLLGEMTATAAIIGGNLKQPGRLSFQLSGHGPLKSMILDVNQDLQIRGMARYEPGIHDAPLPALFGDGKRVGLVLGPRDQDPRGIAERRQARRVQRPGLPAFAQGRPPARST